MRRSLRITLQICLAVWLAACAAPRALPEGPTPIPTLIPATAPIRPIGLAATPSFTVLSYPARLPSAELGQSLYDAFCARCHGDDGQGTIPGARDFGDVDYMRGETPASFYAAVTEGRGGMPAFRDRLSSDARWDVVFYIWRFSTDVDTLALGQSLYNANCDTCHGADGTGQVLGATDLNDLRLVDNRAPRDFYLILTQGKGSMPAWQARLSQDQRWAVIDYVRTFSYEAALPGDAAAAPLPTAVAGPVVCDPSYLAQTNPFDWNDAEAVLSGRTIYDQACAVCHGADGSGALPGTSDFTTAEVQNDLLANAGQFLCAVAEGQGSMPGWKETLSVDQMWQLLTFISTLGR